MKENALALELIGALDTQKVLKSFLLDIAKTDSVSASKINIFRVGKNLLN